MLRTTLSSAVALLFLSLSLVACGGDEGETSANGASGEDEASSGGANDGTGGSASDGGTASGGTSDGADGSGGSTADGSGGSDSSVGTGPCFDGTCQGTCFGTSCGGEWTCDTTAIACTMDIATYCGCDGETFTDSGSCPSQAYANKGACTAAGTDSK